MEWKVFIVRRMRWELLGKEKDYFYLLWGEGMARVFVMQIAFPFCGWAEHLTGFVLTGGLRLHFQGR